MQRILHSAVDSIHMKCSCHQLVARFVLSWGRHMVLVAGLGDAIKACGHE